MFTDTAPKEEFLISTTLGTESTMIAPLRIIFLPPRNIPKNEKLCEENTNANSGTKLINTKKIEGEIYPKLIVSDEYTNYIKENLSLRKYDVIIRTFLNNFFKNQAVKPKFYELTMFFFPEEDYEEPIARIIYSNRLGIELLKLGDELELQLKNFLAEQSKDLAEFKEMREIQKKFRIVYHREN